MIYILGSLNMDFTAQTRVPKKGETVIAESYGMFCGGKGANQAAAVAKLGGAAAMIGHVGRDANGRVLKEHLKSLGVDVTHVTEKGAESGAALILVTKGDNRIVVCPGANALWEESETDDALQHAKAGDILIAQLEIPPETVLYAFKAAKAKGMTTVLNPAPAVSGLHPALFGLTDIITPNETETEILTGVNPVDTVHTALAVKQFYRLGVGSAVITLGARGAAVSEGYRITEIDPHPVTVVDTTAAGDTFIGALAVKLSEGADIVSACRFANYAASITVGRKGAAASIPTRDEAERIFREL